MNNLIELKKIINKQRQKIINLRSALAKKPKGTNVSVLPKLKAMKIEFPEPSWVRDQIDEMIKELE